MSEPDSPQDAAPPGDGIFRHLLRVIAPYRGRIVAAMVFLVVARVANVVSVLSLTASRYAEVGLAEISLGRNWRFALVNSLVACGVLSVAAVLMR